MTTRLLRQFYIYQGKEQEKEIYIHFELADLIKSKISYIKLDYKDKTESNFNFSQVLI